MNLHKRVYTTLFSFKLKEQLKSPKKTYSHDTDMAKSVKFALAHGTGKLMENIVAVELLRRGIEPYSCKTANGKKVDFVIKKGNDIVELIQASYAISDYSTKKRELSIITKAAEELKCDRLTVITRDYAGQESFKDKPIPFLPLWRWLLPD